MAGDPVAARARLEAAGATIVAAVAAELPRYLTSRSARVLDAWARLSDEARARVDAALAAAAAAETERVVGALRELFAQGPEAQRATPLEIVRGAVRGPTEVLRAARVGPVVRDDFEERAWPDDDYGLTPRAAADLGDADLGPALLAWGLAKSALLRANAHGG